MNSFASLLAIVAVVLVYRHASGKAQYNKVLILVMCLLAIIPCLIAAYVGYRHNPNRNNLKFREVL